MEDGYDTHSQRKMVHKYTKKVPQTATYLSSTMIAPLTLHHGVLVVKTRLVRNPVPDGGGGGGTVFFVRRDQHRYLQNVEAREEAGTPAIVEAVRAGLVLQLKEALGPEQIRLWDDAIVSRFLREARSMPKLVLLGPRATSCPRLPIFSFLVATPSGAFLHHNFVAALLNDLLGVQTRGGCACAGPYAQDLLGIDEALAERYERTIAEDSRLDRTHLRRQGEYSSYELLRPGFTRVTLSYLLSEDELEHVITALRLVSEHGWKLLPQYRVNPETGEWRHHSNLVLKERRWLGDIRYGSGRMEYRQRSAHPPAPELRACAARARALIDSAKKNCPRQVPDHSAMFDAAATELRWFLLPNEARLMLHGTAITMRPPFKPRVYSGQGRMALGRRRAMSESRDPPASPVAALVSASCGRRVVAVSVVTPPATPPPVAAAPVAAAVVFSVSGSDDAAERSAAAHGGGTGASGADRLAAPIGCCREQPATDHSRPSSGRPREAPGGQGIEPKVTSVREIKTSDSCSSKISDSREATVSDASDGIVSDSCDSKMSGSSVAHIDSGVGTLVSDARDSEISDDSGAKTSDIKGSPCGVRLESESYDSSRLAGGEPGVAGAAGAGQAPSGVVSGADGGGPDSASGDGDGPAASPPSPAHRAPAKAQPTGPQWHAPPRAIFKKTAEAIEEFSMLRPDDRVLVCLSGGKDSLSLLHVLRQYQFVAASRGAPFHLAAVTVDPQSSAYDPRPLRPYLAKLGVPYYYEVQGILRQAEEVECSSICSFCSRMKRGRLYAAARRQGYNVLAFGQHLDDVSESFLMSVFHNGRLRTMKACYAVTEEDLRVIRPLIYVREKELRRFAESRGLPVIPENCPACFEEPKERHRVKQLPAQRERPPRVKQLLAQQEVLFPHLFESLRAALRPLYAITRTGVESRLFGRAAAEPDEGRGQQD
ncbi:uncharacterized protein LOC119108188 [Pollicipes pollicipes]|uniref:uncharacterized protein LOC119108188 n=1 Tax=Pollicipes pollicipes TaxID=41117 RepID=UPI001884E64C|nr:uncharacterized protein LOC119108188 [Pollicipes pollicipes]